MPANVFLHFLHRARVSSLGEHHDDTWLDHLPKKLDSKVAAAALRGARPLQPGAGGRLVFGWGVHILEGPNHSILGILLTLGIAATFVISGLVVGLAKTEEQGFGVGSYLFAIIVAVMGAVYFRLQD